MDDSRIGNVQRTGTLDEYEQRLAAITNARLASELTAQLADLPPQFRFDPGRPLPATPAPADGNVRNLAVAALVLGIASIPLSICLVGGLLGIASTFLNVPGSRGTSGWSMALIGQVLGIVGIVLSLGVLTLVIVSPA